MSNYTPPRHTDEVDPVIAPGAPAPQTDFGDNGVGNTEEAYVGTDDGIVSDGMEASNAGINGRDQFVGGAVDTSSLMGMSGDAETGLGDGDESFPITDNPGSGLGTQAMAEEALTEIKSEERAPGEF